MTNLMEERWLRFVIFIADQSSVRHGFSLRLSGVFLIVSQKSLRIFFTVSDAVQSLTEDVLGETRR